MPIHGPPHPQVWHRAAIPLDIDPEGVYMSSLGDIVIISHVKQL